MAQGRRRPGRGPQQLLGLPAFLLGVFFLYWSVPLGVLLGHIKAWKMRGRRDDGLGWATALQRLFGVRMLLLPGPPLCQESPVVFLSNHRSWADFFLDVVATRGRAQMLSRCAVFWAFPAMMSAVVAIRAVVLFRRGGRMDKQKFNALIDAKMAASKMEGLIVYPEGHRSTLPSSLPLKRGMLAYVFSRKMPVQIVMSANKEAVMSEKDVSCRFGQEVLVGYSAPLQSRDHPTLDAFVGALQAEWDAQWGRLASADWAEARPLETEPGPSRDYPPLVRYHQLAAVGLNFAALAATLYWGSKLALWTLSFAGSWQAYVWALLAVWTCASLLNAQRRVRLPLQGKPQARTIANGVAH